MPLIAYGNRNQGFTTCILLPNMLVVKGTFFANWTLSCGVRLVWEISMVTFILFTIWHIGFHKTGEQSHREIWIEKLCYLDQITQLLWHFSFDQLIGWSVGWSIGRSIDGSISKLFWFFLFLVFLLSFFFLVFLLSFKFLNINTWKRRPLNQRSIYLSVWTSVHLKMPTNAI